MENKNDYSEFERYHRAKKKVEEIKGFYSHLTVYVCVMLFLMFINLKYSSDHLWFFYPMSVWGIGVFFHAVKVFDWFPILGKDWEQRKLQEFLKEEENKNQTKN